MNAQMKALKVLADNGDTQAQYQLGAILIAGDYNTEILEYAVRMTENAAEKGHTQAINLQGEAFYALGVSHYQSHTTNASTNAIHYLVRAAELGYKPAYQALGDAYRRGRKGISINLKEAEQWYLAGALKDHLPSMLQLAKLILKRNDGTDASKTEIITAIHWLTIAGAKGHAPSKKELVSIYGDGYYMDTNETMCSYWLTK